MDKVLTYTLREEDLAVTANGLVNLILKNCVHITGHEVSRAKFAGGGITADGEQVTVKDRIRPGQTLRVALPEKTSSDEGEGAKVPAVPAPPGILSFLYEDEDVVVLNKPAGIVVHPTHGHWYDTLGNYLADHYEKQGAEVVCHVAGRLDMDTSGALVFAKNRAAAGRLAKQRQDGTFKRTYRAIVHGVPGGPYTIDAPIERKPDTLMVRQVASDGGGERAVTHYRVLKSGRIADGAELSLAEFHIDTGRTHQIRVHMAYIGHPLAFDPLYGDEECDRQLEILGIGSAERTGRAMLHAACVEFLQPFTGEKIRVTAPEPADFASLEAIIIGEKGGRQRPARAEKIYTHLTHEDFGPLYDSESRTLILGSFPSVKSREQRFFYGHPQNRFWKILAALYGTEVPQTIEEKTEFALSHHLALYDVIESCDIVGSSDASIRNTVPTDLVKILAETKVDRIFVNGATAYKLYEKYQEKTTGIRAGKLPSSSPANAAWSLEKLADAWKVIL